MPMNATYRNAIRNHGASLITHIGLTNGSGTELAGGGYARLAVTWNTTDTDGLMRPNADLVFNVEGGDTVGAWQGYSALTAGTAYGENTLTPAETFGANGTYRLLAASTSVDHNAV